MAHVQRADMDSLDGKMSKWLGVRLAQDRQHFEKQVLELTTFLQHQHTELVADMKKQLEVGHDSASLPTFPAEVTAPVEPRPSALASVTGSRHVAWDASLLKAQTHSSLGSKLHRGLTSEVGSRQVQKQSSMTPAMKPERSSTDQPLTRTKSRFRNNDAVEMGRLQKLVNSAGFEISTGMLIFINTMILAFEIQYHGIDNGYTLQVARYHDPAVDVWPGAEPAFLTAEYLFSFVFILELAVRVCASPGQAVRSGFIWMDAVLVSVSIIDMSQQILSEDKDGFFLNATMMRIFRLVRIVRVLKMVRAVRAFDSLYLLLRSIQASFGALVWSFLFLLFVQISAGMFVCQMVRSHIEDGATAKEITEQLLQDNPDQSHEELTQALGAALQSRREVWLYFGTFSRTMLTMFEITMANWAPSCRTLMDNVSEWYALFYLIYRCMFCFAVLKVIAAVFINETNRVASNDDEIAMMRDRKSTAIMTVKLKEVFSELDVTGDGEVDWAELEDALSDRQMQAWLKSLDVDIHHLADLFALIDNGEGKITLSEFIEGVTRSKGHAKSIDILLLKRMIHHLEDKLDSLPKSLRSGTGSGAGPLREAALSNGSASNPVEASLAAGPLAVPSTSTVQ
mmetsp:Transcript_7942/g.17626  ORF Transcript_7942/g.17626 Transcript_7942/m.17626 type:complete len:624 (+) Transcript_7942:138-2009(+)